MEYVKFIIAIVSDPMNHFLLFVLLSLFFSKKLARNLILAITYLFIMSLPLSHSLMTSAWSYPDSYQVEKKYTTLILLQGVSNFKWHEKVGEQVRNGYCQFNQHAERVALALLQLKKNNTQNLVLGHLTINEFDETACLTDFFIAQGIGKNRIIIMSDVQSTRDESEAVKRLAAKKNIGNSLLLTSRNHMRRAYKMFSKRGLMVDTLSTGKPMKAIHVSELVPSSLALNKNQKLFYEMLSYTAYWLTGGL